MTNIQRNKIVNDLIAKIKSGDEKAKITLFYSYVIPWFEAFYCSKKDRFMSNSERQLLKDLEQDLWFHYEQALQNWDNRIAFLSYIIVQFKSVLNYITNYKTGINQYYSKKLQQVIIIPLWDDIVSVDDIPEQDEENETHYLLTCFLDKLSPIEALAIQLYWHIIPIPVKNTYSYVTASDVATYLYEHNYTKEKFSPQWIRQILHEGYKKMGIKNTKEMKRGRLVNLKNWRRQYSLNRYWDKKKKK